MGNAPTYYIPHPSSSSLTSRITIASHHSHPGRHPVISGASPTINCMVKCSRLTLVVFIIHPSSTRDTQVTSASNISKYAFLVRSYTYYNLNSQVLMPTRPTFRCSGAADHFYTFGIISICLVDSR